MQSMVNPDRTITIPGCSALVCPVCHKDFIRPNAHIRGKTNCCSLTCSQRIRNRRPKTINTYTCQHCGQEFKNRVGAGGKNLFCSRKCQANRKNIRRGPNHPNWKGGISKRPHASRKAVQDRLMVVKQCQRCGSDKHLQGHHIKPYAKNPELAGDPNNIEVLCSVCHAAEHPELASMITRPHQLTGKEIQCLVCGTPRYVPPHVFGSAKFCSKKCQNLWLNSPERRLRSELRKRESQARSAA
jgi:5-methylcytosine-specific restriction endonuclease McrA